MCEKKCPTHILKIQTHFTTTKSYFSGVIAMSFFYGTYHNII